VRGGDSYAVIVRIWAASAGKSYGSPGKRSPMTRRDYGDDMTVRERATRALINGNEAALKRHMRALVNSQADQVAPFKRGRV
jgi:hypothetical protein